MPAVPPKPPKPPESPESLESRETRVRSSDVQLLAGRLAGPVFLPGDSEYDTECTGFNLAVRRRPDVVVGARSAADVREAVAFAAARDLPVGVQNTGHGPANTAAGDGGMLISTGRMTDIRIDPAAETAWVAAGVRSGDLVAEAARHGLAPLNGSAPQVGVVAYLLGGGMSLLSRSHGLAVDRVRTLEVVTADGRYRRVSPVEGADGRSPTAQTAPDETDETVRGATSEAELAWALLGGRDTFGIVTAVEVELVPLERFYGGGLFFDAASCPDTLEIYRRWTRTVPEEMNSSVALVPFPDVEGVPEPLRGRAVYHVRIACTAPAARAEALVAALHEAGPRLLEWGAQIPYSENAAVHDEPPGPMAWLGDSALLGELDGVAVQRLLDQARPGAQPRCIIELRHLGGAAARGRKGRNAVGHRDAQYHLGVLVALHEDSDTAAAEDALARLSQAVEPWRIGRFPTFLGQGRAVGPEAIRSAFDASDHARLRHLKQVWDSGNLFRRGPSIPAAGG